MANKQTEEKRGRGRPANFPGQEVTARLYKLPNTTIEAAEEARKTLSGDRLEPIGVTIDRLINRGLREVNRRNRKQ